MPSGILGLARRRPKIAIAMPAQPVNRSSADQNDPAHVKNAASLQGAGGIRKDSGKPIFLSI